MHYHKQWKKLHITVSELYPILVAVAVFANKLANKHVRMHSDNMAVVSVINVQTSKCPRVMHLLRILVLVCLQHNINFRASHIPGQMNKLPDKLSHLKFDDQFLESHSLQKQL